MNTIQDTYLYRSTDAAYYLIAKANEGKYALTMTKVQKLLYIVYGVYLRVYGRRLVDEHPQAWPYGPVFPTTRRRLLGRDFAQVGLQDIAAPVRQEMAHDGGLNWAVEFVLSHFGGWNARMLSAWSHQPGSPWDKTTQLPGFNWCDTIPDEWVLDYFQRIILRQDGSPRGQQ